MRIFPSCWILMTWCSGKQNQHTPTKQNKKQNKAHIDRNLAEGMFGPMLLGCCLSQIQLNSLHWSTPSQICLQYMTSSGQAFQMRVHCSHLVAIPQKWSANLPMEFWVWNTPQTSCPKWISVSVKWSITWSRSGTSSVHTSANIRNVPSPLHVWLQTHNSLVQNC